MADAEYTLSFNTDFTKSITSVRDYRRQVEALLSSIGSGQVAQPRGGVGPRQLRAQAQALRSIPSLEIQGQVPFEQLSAAVRTRLAARIEQMAQALETAATGLEPLGQRGRITQARVADFNEELAKAASAAGLSRAALQELAARVPGLTALNPRELLQGIDAAAIGRLGDTDLGSRYDRLRAALDDQIVTTQRAADLEQEANAIRREQDRQIRSRAAAEQRATEEATAAQQQQRQNRGVQRQLGDLGQQLIRRQQDTVEAAQRDAEAQEEIARRDRVLSDLTGERVGLMERLQAATEERIRAERLARGLATTEEGERLPVPAGADQAYVAARQRELQLLAQASEVMARETRAREEVISAQSVAAREELLLRESVRRYNAGLEASLNALRRAEAGLATLGSLPTSEFADLRANIQRQAQALGLDVGGLDIGSLTNDQFKQLQQYFAQTQRARIAMQTVAGETEGLAGIAAQAQAAERELVEAQRRAASAELSALAQRVLTAQERAGADFSQAAIAAMSREEQDLLRRKLQQRERSIAQGTAAHQIEASNIGVIEQVAVANRAILRDKTAAAAAARREREAQVRAALAAGEGSLIQRAQARLALATGGSGGGFGGVGGGGPRLPGEYPGLAGFFGRGALGGLQYGLPSLLLYRGVPAIADSVREAEELNIQLGLIERQLTSIGQEDSFDDLRDTILEVAANTGLASDELANTALLFAGAFGPEAAAGLRDIGAELEAAGELALVAGVSFDELEDSVIGVTRAFSEGADITTVRELGDIAVYLREQFGVAVTDITGFLGDIAPVAQAAGFSLEQIGLLGAQSLQLSGKGTAALAEAWGRVLPALNENRVAILQLVDGTRLYDSTLEAVQLGDYSNVLKNLIALYGDADEAQRAQIVSLIGERREAQAILPVFEQGTRVLANWDSELETNGKLSDLAADVTERLTTRWAALTEQLNQLMRQVLEGGLAEGLEALLSIFQLLVSVLTDVASVLADVNDSLGGWPAKIAVAVAAFRGLTAVLRAASAAMTRYAAASATAQGGAVAGGIGGAAAGAAGGGLLAGAGRFGAAATGALGGPLGIALAIGGTVAFQLRDVGKQANEAVQAALRESVEEEAERTREELDSVVSELRDDASKGSLAQQIRTQDFSSLWNSIIGSDPTGILGGILGSFGAGQEPTGLEEYRAFREEQGNRIYQDLLSQYEDLLTLEGDAQNTAILAVQSTMRDIVTEDQERFDQFVIGLIELWFEGELESSEINALLFLFDFDDDTRGRLDAKIQDQLGLEQSTIDAVFRGIEGAQRNRGTDVNVEAWQSALTKLDEDAAAVIEEYGYQRVASDRNLQEAIFGADAARENVLGGALAETQQRIDELRYDIDVGQGREIDLIPLLEQEIADLERLVKPGAGGGAVLEGADALKARRDIAERFAEIQEIQDSVLLADIQNELEIAELRGAESPLVDAETALSILEGALQSEDLSPTARAELTPQIIDAIQKLTEERAEEAFEAQNYDEYLQIAQDGIDVADRFLIIFDAISQTTQAYARPENAAELRSLVAQVVGGQADISLSIILQILDQMYEAQLIALSEYNAFKRSVGRAAAREAGIPEGIIGAEERAGTDWTGIVEDVGESRQRVLDSIAPDITESEAASRVAAEQAKAAADAQRAADEANRVARANLEAEYALAIARANAQDDDVRVAELELDYARELLALLRQQGASYAEITKQEAAVIDAEAALRRAREENGEDRRAALEAEYAYRIAQAESLGDRSEAARLELELQQRILRLMESEGASDVDLQQQRTSILQAQTAAQEAVLQARLEELQFLYDMGELDNTAYIAELEALLASGTLRVDQVRDIRRKLQALRNDVSRDLRVNLPDFALPTLYEARRAVAEADIGAFAPGRGGYQDQRVTTINLYASNAVDGEAAVMFIANSVGGPTRIGGRIGRY